MAKDACSQVSEMFARVTPQTTHPIQFPMNTTTKYVTLLALIATLSACGDRGSQEAPRTEEPAATAENETEEASENRLEIASLNVSIAVPEGASTMAMGESTIVTAPGLGAFSIRLARSSDAADPEAYQEREDAILATPAQDWASEELADGWVSTHLVEAPVGAIFAGHVRREIGDQDLRCETSVPSAEQRAAAMTACKSILAL